MARLLFRPFTVGAFTFVDAEAVSDGREAELIRQTGRNNLKALIAKTRDTQLCDTSNQFHARRSRAWKATHARDPSTTWPEFLARFDRGLDDADCDPRLPQVLFGILRGDPRARDLFGAFYLYNVKVEEETARKVTATAYPAPGFPFTTSAEWVDRMAEVLRTLLTTDVFLMDGRTFSLSGWEFPTDRPGHRWAGESWPEQLVSRLTGEGFEKEANGGAVKRLRRRVVTAEDGQAF